MTFHNRIQAVFFDLDNTLFDHTRAERTALSEILTDNVSAGQLPAFLEAYHEANTVLWRELAAGQIAGDVLKVRRFEMAFSAIGMAVPDCSELALHYLELYSLKAFTVSGAVAISEYLQKKYVLGILSNGFPEIQRNKLTVTALGTYFRHQIFSGDVGVMKPDRAIFDKAARAVRLDSSALLYIGDSVESDVAGAKNAGWNAIFFNPSRSNISHQADAEIAHLEELRQLL